MKGFLEGKTILIMGVRNRWSIAWAIAQSAAEEGAALVFTVQSGRELEQTAELVRDLGDYPVLECDVGSDDSIQSSFEELRRRSGVIHGLVHAIAHARSEDLEGDFIATTREGFAHALNVSAYSLIAVSRAARGLMSGGGAIVTLSYIGAERVVPGYKVMGVAKAALEATVRYLASELGSSSVRVNAISAGPIKTLSAKGIPNFGNLLETAAGQNPLRRAVDRSDIAGTALYLLSDASAGVTGEVIHVDAGYHIMGV
ncbi:enoyl-[acyl-carrier-protein] reductase [NADH] [Hydrogenispora ethanolica]|uniref:Enoyl-[acyl-carrier-protein] reductase [NADH] n=1 Tax=Hydrogenispora ethanolica TaxID=1082276 RepID=A0A4R1S720_HYDET|nr:enoyl-ACP reductase [Hydrogenispora ethanolica]TCL75183.1 enoyl-[acyl-carrier-protein] reductase [NADH] [Hydrogenispora ethanolica]